MTDNVEHDSLRRRGFLGVALLAAAGAAAAGVALLRKRKPIQRSQRPGRRPNVIFILADDLGYGDLGSYGQTQIQTPNLDTVAAEGARFTQCYAASPVCSPSRGSLMTGLHVGHARVRANGYDNGERIPLRPEDFTVAELFKSAGYVTAMFGKWGLGEAGSTGEPNLQGFDEWLGYLGSEQEKDKYPESLWRNGEPESIVENEDGNDAIYADDLFTQEALDFIQAHQDERFFLYLPYASPHSPLEIPSDEPYTNEDWPQEEKTYAAMITRIDRNVGSILSLLKELGLDEDTIVFFSSDNGASGAGGRHLTFFESVGPLRGKKRQLYEGGIRVPMLARWPGVIEPGTVSDEVWAFWDFLPTAAELARAELPADIDFDGVSIMPVLLGKKSPAREFLYWEFFRWSPRTFSQAVRLGDWKGVRNAPDASIELYDLQADIGEEHDITEDHPDIVGRIADIMETSHVQFDEYPI